MYIIYNNNCSGNLNDLRIKLETNSKKEEKCKREPNKVVKKYTYQ